jgi:GNAT superfamily N-acetyltransferase
MSMTHSRISIRHAEACDVDGAVAIDPQSRRALIAEQFRRGAGQVALRGDELVGFAIVTNHFFGRPFLDLLVVREQSSRAGVGRALVLAIVAEHRGTRVFTSTNESNVAMLRLLESTRFVPAGVILGLDPGDAELVFFHRCEVSPRVGGAGLREFRLRPFGSGRMTRVSLLGLALSIWACAGTARLRPQVTTTAAPPAPKSWRLRRQIEAPWLLRGATAD